MLDLTNDSSDELNNNNNNNQTNNTNTSKRKNDDVLTSNKRTKYANKLTKKILEEFLEEKLAELEIEKSNNKETIFCIPNQKYSVSALERSLNPCLATLAKRIGRVDTLSMPNIFGSGNKRKNESTIKKFFKQLCTSSKTLDISQITDPTVSWDKQPLLQHLQSAILESKRQNKKIVETIIVSDALVANRPALEAQLYVLKCYVNNVIRKESEPELPKNPQETQNTTIVQTQNNQINNASIKTPSSLFMTPHNIDAINNFVFNHYEFILNTAKNAKDPKNGNDNQVILNLPKTLTYRNVNYKIHEGLMKELMEKLIKKDGGNAALIHSDDQFYYAEYKPNLEATKRHTI